MIYFLQNISHQIFEVLLKNKSKFLVQYSFLTTSFFFHHNFITHPPYHAIQTSSRGLDRFCQSNILEGLLNTSFNREHCSWIMNNFCIKDPALLKSKLCSFHVLKVIFWTYDWLSLVLFKMIGWQHILVWKGHLKNFSCIKSCLKRQVIHDWVPMKSFEIGGSSVRSQQWPWSVSGWKRSKSKVFRCLTDGGVSQPNLKIGWKLQRRVEE